MGNKRGISYVVRDAAITQGQKMKQNSWKIFTMVSGLVAFGLGAWGLQLTQQKNTLDAALNSARSETASQLAQIEELKNQLRASQQRKLAPIAEVAATTPALPSETSPSRLTVSSDDVAATNALPQPEERPATSWTDRMRQRLEDMRVNNPEEFAAEQERMEARRQEMTLRMDERISFFNTLDTSTLSEEYKQNHLALLGRLETNKAIMNDIMVDPLAEGNAEKMREVFSSFRELDNMMRMQREVLYHDLAREAGYQGESAAEFVQYVEHIQRMTQLPGGRGGRGGGGGWNRGDAPPQNQNPAP